MEQHFNWNEISVDETKKNLALAQISIAVEQKKTEYHVSIFKIFWNQIKYISLQYWLLQFGFMLFSFFALHVLKCFDAELINILNLATTLVTSIGVISSCELNKCVSCNMVELEQSCYFNSRQLFCIKMILFGLCDTVFLTILIAANKTRSDLISFSLYIMVPFLLSCIGYLIIFNFSRGKSTIYSYILAGVFFGAFALIILNLPGVCKIANRGFWIMALFISAIGLGLEIWHLLTKFGERDTLCTN